MFTSVNADNIKRIVVGNKDAKISIIAFESLTCSHCANFHKNVYPKLKKEYIDTGLAKIEFRHFPLDIAAFNASKVSQCNNCLLYTSPSPRDGLLSRMPSSA